MIGLGSDNYYQKCPACLSDCSILSSIRWPNTQCETDQSSKMIHCIELSHLWICVSYALQFGRPLLQSEKLCKIKTHIALEARCNIWKVHIMQTLEISYIVFKCTVYLFIHWHHPSSINYIWRSARTVRETLSKMTNMILNAVLINFLWLALPLLTSKYSCVPWRGIFMRRLFFTRPLASLMMHLQSSRIDQLGRS